MSKKKTKKGEASPEMLKEYLDQNVDSSMMFDLDMDAASDTGGLEIEISILKQMLEEANAKNFKYEAFLLSKGLMEEAVESYLSDEEFICQQGIEYIKRLVAHGTFTKDDINSFDVLHRNLCLIRGISLERKKNKKDAPKNREELLKLINTKKA